MAGVPDSQPSELSTEVPGQDASNKFAKQLTAIKMPSTNVAETPPPPEIDPLEALADQHASAETDPLEALADEHAPNRSPEEIAKNAIAKNTTDLDPTHGNPDVYDKVTRGALASLPVIGGIGGAAAGLAGGAVTGTGALVTAGAGGALGSMAGTELERAGKHYLLGEDVSTGAEHAKELGVSALGGAIQEPGAQAAEKVGQAVTDVAPKVLSKLKEVPLLGKAINVSEDALKTFVSRAKVVDQMSKSANGNVAAAADTIKQNFQDDLKSYFQKINDTVTTVLKRAGNGATVSPQGAIDSIDTAMGKASNSSALSASERQAKVQNLQDLKKTIMNRTDPETGRMTALDANEVKKELWDRGFEQSGNITDEAKVAAHSINDEISSQVPAAKALNAHQAKVYDLMDTATAKGLSGAKPEGVLLKAGNNAGNGREAMELGRLGDASETDIATQANNLAAMKAFKAKGALLGNKLAGATAIGINKAAPGAVQMANPAINQALRNKSQ